MTNKFVGIELRNIEFEDDEFGSLYVDKDEILFFKPSADFSSEISIYKEACEYLENYGKNVVSCDQAKINEVYYIKG